jgi:hypothetical protein
MLFAHPCVLQRAIGRGLINALSPLIETCGVLLQSRFGKATLLGAITNKSHLRFSSIHPFLGTNSRQSLAPNSDPTYFTMQS